MSARQVLVLSMLCLCNFVMLSLATFPCAALFNNLEAVSLSCAGNYR